VPENRAAVFAKPSSAQDTVQGLCLFISKTHAVSGAGKQAPSQIFKIQIKHYYFLCFRLCFETWYQEKKVFLFVVNCA